MITVNVTSRCRSVSLILRKTVDSISVGRETSMKCSVIKNCKSRPSGLFLYRCVRPNVSCDELKFDVVIVDWDISGEMFMFSRQFVDIRLNNLQGPIG